MVALRRCVKIEFIWNVENEAAETTGLGVEKYGAILSEVFVSEVVP